MSGRGPHAQALYGCVRGKPRDKVKVARSCTVAIVQLVQSTVVDLRTDREPLRTSCSLQLTFVRLSEVE